MQSVAHFIPLARGARTVAAVAIVLALAGCFLQQSRKDEADAKAAAAYAQCEARLTAGQYKTHLAAVNCAAPAVVGAYQEAAYPFQDLVYISIQARRIGAAKVDSGDLTESQYQHDLAELDARLAAEDARRRGIMTYGGNPQRTPVEQLVQGLPAFVTAPTAAALPPPPPPGSCIPLGEIRPCK